MSQDLGCTLSGLGSARAKSADCPSSRIGFPCRKFVLGARLLGTGSLEFALSGGWQALALLDLRLSASAAFWVEESLSSVAVRDARLVKVPVAAMEERVTGTTGAVHSRGGWRRDTKTLLKKPDKRSRSWRRARPSVSNGRLR